MFVFPVSFTSKFTVKSSNSSGIDEEGVLKEINVAQKAKKMGVSVPNYDVSFSYTTKGEIADYKTNKINQKHLKSLFENLVKMDMNNLNHNDLDIAHVFYDKDGSVELDCFRFSSPFIVNSSKNYNLPDFMPPTNLVNYENASLCFYVEQIPSKEEKLDFLKTYLKESSIYHGVKANWVFPLIGKVTTKEMYNYEIVNSSTLENPDNEMAEHLLAKLDLFKKQRTAFTEWDEGNGACGHSFDKQRRIDSIPMYLEAVKSAIDYSNKSLELSKKHKKNCEKSEYYNFEAKTGEYFANTYLSWIKGMADYNFKDERVCPIPDEERKNLNSNYEKIIDADFSSKQKLINDYIDLYNQKTSKKL